MRFSENFAPAIGTIAEHQILLAKNGYVYYGKMGSAISKKNKELILAEDHPRILLIHSGGTKRYWAYISEITSSRPKANEFPSYYYAKADLFKTWFRITKIEEAPGNIMSTCIVASSGSSLTEASRYSMSPYFVIDCEE